ncbi:MAG: hypothetical protein ABI891_09050, partial [Acidobacteriota bacterium]
MKFSVLKSEKDFDAHFQSQIWVDAVQELCRRHRVSFNKIERAGGSEHIVFFVDDALVLKIYRPFRSCFERESKALEAIGGKTFFKIPEIIYQGKFEHFSYILMTRMKGDLMTRIDWLKIPEKT